MIAQSQDSVPVQWSVAMEVFFPESRDRYARRPKDLMKKTFDEVPILEVRKQCLDRINVDYEEDFRWIAGRVQAYLNIPHARGGREGTVADFGTALMLLRKLAYLPERFRKDAFELMLDVLEKALDRPGGVADTVMKEIIVIFCGYITHHPKDYNDRARDLIKRILAGGYRYQSEPDRQRVLQRLFLVIEKVGDATFLPLIEGFVFLLTGSDGSENLNRKLEYLEISRESIMTDALARQAVAVLSRLSPNLEKSL